jgi:hypothetical protein
MRLHSWVTTALTLSDLEWLNDVIAGVEAGEQDRLRELAVDKRGRGMRERMQRALRRARRKAKVVRVIARVTTADQARDFVYEYKRLMAAANGAPIKRHLVSNLAEKLGISIRQARRMAHLVRVEHGARAR